MYVFLNDECIEQNITQKGRTILSSIILYWERESLNLWKNVFLWREIVSLWEYRIFTFSQNRVPVDSLSSYRNSCCHSTRTRSSIVFYRIFLYNIYSYWYLANFLRSCRKVASKFPKRIPFQFSYTSNFIEVITSRKTQHFSFVSPLSGYRRYEENRI